jgi:hypothetical protein
MTEWRSRKCPAEDDALRAADASTPVPPEPASPAAGGGSTTIRPAATDRDQGDAEHASDKAKERARPHARTLEELMQLSGVAPERRLTLTEVAVVIGSQTGRRPSSSTCWRWALKGVRGKKLDVIRVGGVLYATMASVEAFLDGQPSLASAEQRPAPTKPARTTVASQMAAERRRRDREAAKRHLDEVCSPKKRTPR